MSNVITTEEISALRNSIAKDLSTKTVKEIEVIYKSDVKKFKNELSLSDFVNYEKLKVFFRLQIISNLYLDQILMKGK